MALRASRNISSEKVVWGSRRETAHNIELSNLWLGVFCSKDGLWVKMYQLALSVGLDSLWYRVSELIFNLVNLWLRSLL